MDKAKPVIEGIRGLNMAAVKHTTVQVTRLSLYRKLLQIGQNLLYLAWNDRGPEYVVYIYIYIYTYIYLTCLTCKL
jgi:hypothetical protein